MVTDHTIANCIKIVKFLGGSSHLETGDATGNSEVPGNNFMPC
jgi:hypothetical protein